jgi:Fuc2NAc and GlcNAc transferase
MDGIDGMAGTEAFFICAAASWLIGAQDSALRALLGVVAAGSAGFLLWNWPPAKIFMGDVGSAYLGFLIAIIAFATVLREPIALPTWIILWTLFLADTAVALLRRMLRGERWWMAHRSHAYQHLSTRFSSHALVTAMYGAINLGVILPSAWYAHSHPHEAWWVCGLVFSAAMALAYANNAGQESPVSS